MRDAWILVCQPLIGFQYSTAGADGPESDVAPPIDRPSDWTTRQTAGKMHIFERPSTAGGMGWAGVYFKYVGISPLIAVQMLAQGPGEKVDVHHRI